MAVHLVFYAICHGTFYLNWRPHFLKASFPCMFVKNFSQTFILCCDILREYLRFPLLLKIEFSAGNVFKFLSVSCITPISFVCEEWLSQNVWKITARFSSYLVERFFLLLLHGKYKQFVFIPIYCGNPISRQKACFSYCTT